MPNKIKKCPPSVARIKILESHCEYFDKCYGFAGTSQHQPVIDHWRRNFMNANILAIHFNKSRN